MPGVKRVIKCKAYVNTASSSAHATPTWAELSLIEDATRTAEWTEATAHARLTLVELVARTGLKLELGGEMLKDTSNAGYTKLADAFADPDVQVDVLVLDGDETLSGSDGVRFRTEVVKWSEDQSRGATLHKEFTLKPGFPAVIAEIPKVAKVASGAPVFTDFDPS